jgi:DNA-binding NarL/FixJ family response regulator
MEFIRLMIVDDHALFREGLRALFSAIEDIELVSEATTGQDAVDLAEKHQPDVVLMDIDMPGMDGVQATRRILNMVPSIGVVMVTMLEDDASVFSAMRAGARGYVLKGAQADELLQTIRAVAGGQALFGPAIAARMMHFFNQQSELMLPSLPDEVFPELTPREREVLELIARGERNSAIAEKLVISDKTVRNHITNIFSKLQVADRAQAIFKARHAGLDALPPVN